MTQITNDFSIACRYALLHAIDQVDPVSPAVFARGGVAVDRDVACWLTVRAPGRQEHREFVSGNEAAVAVEGATTVADADGHDGRTRGSASL